MRRSSVRLVKPWYTAGEYLVLLSLWVGEGAQEKNRENRRTGKVVCGILMVLLSIRLEASSRYCNTTIQAPETSSFSTNRYTIYHLIYRNISHYQQLIEKYREKTSICQCTAALPTTAQSIDSTEMVTQTNSSTIDLNIFYQYTISGFDPCTTPYGMQWKSQNIKSYTEFSISIPINYSTA